MKTDIAEQIAKELEQRRLLAVKCLGGAYRDQLTTEYFSAEAAAIIRQCTEPMIAFTEAAQAYVSIRSNHPQEAGGAWRDLCAAEEKLRAALAAKEVAGE